MSEVSAKQVGVHVGGGEGGGEGSVRNKIALASSSLTILSAMNDGIKIRENRGL